MSLRETEKKIQSLIECQNLTIIVGAPGIGKSYAVQEATKCMPTVVIDLRHLLAAKRVEEHICIRLGMEELSDQKKSRRKDPRLIILDNLDAGIDASRLCEKWPLLKCVVTSVHQRGASFSPPLLSLSESRTLFENDCNIKVSRTFLEALQGNPLAIKLSTSWVKLYGSEGLEKRIQSFVLSPGTPLRKSYNLAWTALDSDEQELLQVASLFQEKIDVHGLESILGRPPIELLHLERQHWFESTGQLQQSARVFLKERPHNFHSKFQNWVVENAIFWAYESRTKGEWVARSKLLALWPDIRQIAQNPNLISPEKFGEMIMHLRDFTRSTISSKSYFLLVEKALKLGPSPSDQTLLQCYRWTFWATFADRQTALEQLKKLSKNASKLPEVWQRADFISCLAVVMIQSGEDGGFSLLKTSRNEAFQHGDMGSTIRQDMMLTYSSLRLNRLQDATKFAERMRGLAYRERLQTHMALADGWLGTTLHAAGDLERAAELLELASEASRDTPAICLRNLGDLGLVRFDLGRFDDALETFLKAVEMAESSNSWPTLPYLKTCIAYCHYANERYDNARTWLQDSLEMFATFPYGIANSMAYALRISEAIRSGEAPDIWLKKIREAKNIDPKISREAIEALVSGAEYSPKGTTESVLFAALPIGIIDVQKKKLTLKGTVYSFHRRPAAWNILMTLALADAPVDTWTLIEKGWPEERKSEAMINRLYSTITRLRELGLTTWIQTTSEGYKTQGNVRIQYQNPDSGP